MAAPFRISDERLDGSGGNNLQEYLGRLMKLIPGEAVSLYLVGAGIIP
jgi:hypothetical protein